MKTKSRNRTWPVLKWYGARHLRRIALPLGGIGTGTVSLAGNGALRDWELMNRPAKGFAPPRSFFALTCRQGKGAPVSRILEGPIDATDYEGPFGARAPFPGMPRFRDATFGAAYPLGQVRLADPEVPLRARIEAFNPFVPGDSAASSHPAAVIRIVLENPTSRPVTAAVAGSLTNYIGIDGSRTVKLLWSPDNEVCIGAKENRNAWRESKGAGGPRGLFMDSLGVAPDDPAWGTMALTTTAKAGCGVTHRACWEKLGWQEPFLDFWSDFTADGKLDSRPVPEGVEQPTGSLAVQLTVPSRAERSVTFLLTWHFPNRMTWTPNRVCEIEELGGAGAALAIGAEGSTAAANPESPRVGNHYCTQFRDAWEVAERLAPRLPELEAQTVAWVSAFCGSDFPAPVQEAALCTLSSLRTQTCFRIASGEFFGWEGCANREGCCHGSALHVWNYEVALGFLFGDLARSMREVEFLHATDARGVISSRVNLPLSRAREYGLATTDGQSGALVKLHREWRLSGDTAWLRGLWPAARRALDFYWIAGGWDADRDGVMEGCQHNTMDSDYFGPNPPLQSWYLAALRAAEEMARHLGESGLADRCRDLFQRGSAWTDRHLFNGAFYEQEIRPPRDWSSVALGCRPTARAKAHFSAAVSTDADDPQFQLGGACLNEQTVGQLIAHTTGLGDLLDPRRQRAALASVVRHNFKPLRTAQNAMRAYALADEAGLVMATWPRGRRPKMPFPYFSEVMTGFEYVAACHLIYAGRAAAGVRLIRAVRERYDGYRRNPFDEAEAGYHYARTLVSYAAVLAWTGFRHDAVTETIGFAAAKKKARWFWSTGHGWGECLQQPIKGGIRVTLKVGSGHLSLRRFTLGNFVPHLWKKPRSLKAGSQLTFTFRNKS